MSGVCSRCIGDSVAGKAALETELQIFNASRRPVNDEMVLEGL
jgi:hypothetical protein